MCIRFGVAFARTGRGRSFVIPMGDRMPHDRPSLPQSQADAALRTRCRGENIRSVVEEGVNDDEAMRSDERMLMRAMRCILG